MKWFAGHSVQYMVAFGNVKNKKCINDDDIINC